MAKDDYFVVVYRILTYLYACFKAGERPDTDMFGPEALGISNGYWVNVMESIFNEEYIIGVTFRTPIGGMRGIKIFDLRITQKGIEFLQENSLLAKARDFLKTMKETIPGI